MVKFLKIVSNVLILYFLFIAHTNCQPNYQNINYTFDIKFNLVEVTLSMQGDLSGTIKFKLPIIFQLDQAQQQKIQIFIDDIKYDHTINENFISLNHRPLAKIKILYQLHNLENSDHAIQYFNVTQNYFFLSNQYCLLLPEIISEKLHNISFEFPPNYKNIIANIEGKNNIFELSSALISDVNNLFFIGGDVIKNTINDSNSEVIFSSNIKLNKAKIIKYLAKMQSIHNEFFQQITPKNYFIFLSNPNSQYNITGTNINNFQVVVLGNKVKFNYELQRTISHENLHQWFNSDKFGQHPEIQGNNCWLIEGFTDYYTDYLNYRNGIVSLAQYLNIYNKALKDYYTSPLKSLTNSEIGLNAYDTGIYSIAYLRGRIIAHELNDLIEKHTNKKMNLDGYIKYFVHLSATNSFGANTLQKTLFNFIGHDFSNFIKSTLIENNLMVNAQSILDGKAILTLQKFKRIVYDFDFPESKLKWGVSGVKVNSKAFQVGLRNGQKILSTTSTKEGLFFFEIEDDNGSKMIQLQQEYQEILVPQYKN